MIIDVILHCFDDDYIITKIIKRYMICKLVTKKYS